ncbi:hypothetical protein KQX54_017953 [Cotesia glomerata]|uniref:Uncharacterized protein n=1 Tax=Cotesia glomerata TaxID=32391 RepID=A0AAV7J545_COTGL|nr:hypothetical protein KQX54_017953 [Cotesia glomerata]
MRIPKSRNFSEHNYCTHQKGHSVERNVYRGFPDDGYQNYAYHYNFKAGFPRSSARQRRIVGQPWGTPGEEVQVPPTERKIKRENEGGIGGNQQRQRLRELTVSFHT